MSPSRDLISYERIFCDWSKRLKPYEASVAIQGAAAANIGALVVHS